MYKGLCTLLPLTLVLLRSKFVAKSSWGGWESFGPLSSCYGIEIRRHCAVSSYDLSVSSMVALIQSMLVVTASYSLGLRSPTLEQAILQLDTPARAHLLL